MQYSTSTATTAQVRMMVTPKMQTIAILISTLLKSSQSFSPYFDLNLGAGSIRSSTCRSHISSNSGSKQHVHTGKIQSGSIRRTTFPTYRYTGFGTVSRSAGSSIAAFQTRLFSSSIDIDSSANNNINTNTNTDNNNNNIKRMTNVNFSFTTNPTLSIKDDENETTNVIFMAKSSILGTLLESDSFLQNDKNENLSFTKEGSNLKLLSHMISQLTNPKSNHSGDSITSLLPLSSSDKFASCSMISLPSKVSRHNHPMSLSKITELVPKHCPKNGYVKLYIVGVTEKDIAPISMAIARAFPLYSSKSKSGSSNGKSLELDICFLDHHSKPLELTNENILASAKYVSENVRYAAKLVDMPPCELSTNAYTIECQSIAKELGDCVTYKEIRGEKLNGLGYGGIYGVGKAANSENPPTLIVMTYTPEGMENDEKVAESIALCGKGVVYDTGGLSLKSKLVRNFLYPSFFSWIYSFMFW